MGKKRSFFAELQHQQQLAEMKRLREESVAQRARIAAARQLEQAKKQAERAREHAARSSAAEQKAAEREAKRLHEEERQAAVSSFNAELENRYSEIDSILAATLTVDDFVDLEKLRKVTKHPPFPKADLLKPTPQPATLVARPEPQYVAPAAPRGLAAMFGGKKKHAAATAAAKIAYSIDQSAWQAEVPSCRRRSCVNNKSSSKLKRSASPR